MGASVGAEEIAFGLFSQKWNFAWSQTCMTESAEVSASF